ncbi:hypothetical protein Fifi067_00002 [Erwinia phage Fifi067]|nr:hypothetical protein Fifi067_00002 [Erwinia phage Fifi067]WBQ32545.1 hypothetical protein [Erwinia phage Kuerle]
MLTREIVEKALPATLKGAVTPELIAKLNSVTMDQVVAEQVRDNFISYTGVLREGKFRTEDYLNAVTFVSYRLMNHTNKDAYIKTFPDRYQDLLMAGRSDKDISAYVSAYAKNKLVNLILEQSLVPSWVLNQDLFQKALNTQAEIMNDHNVLARDRVAAANSILTHLQKPKEAGPLVNIDMRENSGMNELKATLSSLAQEQRRLIGQGVTAKDIVGRSIFENQEE